MSSRNPQSGGVAVEGVHQGNGGRAIWMLQGEVDGGWAACVVAHGNDLLEPQGLHHRFQITELLLETVKRILRLVGCAEAQKVHRNRSATG